MHEAMDELLAVKAQVEEQAKFGDLFEKADELTQEVTGLIASIVPSAVC